MEVIAILDDPDSIYVTLTALDPAGFSIRHFPLDWNNRDFARGHIQDSRTYRRVLGDERLRSKERHVVM